MLQKTRELDEVVKYLNLTTKAKQSGKNTENIGNLKEKVRQQEAELDD